MSMKDLISISDDIHMVLEFLKYDFLIDKDGHTAEYTWQRLRVSRDNIERLIDTHFESGSDTIIHIHTGE